MLVVFGHRPYIKGVKGFNLENVGVEVNSRGRIVTDDQFNTSVLNIKCTDDATFGLLSRKAEEEGIGTQSREL